tara:strand:+ start:2698 stop:2919 length:222 start_codon:yes stop_codon:yes gene_type:complete
MSKDLEAKVSVIPAITGCFIEYAGLLVGLAGVLDMFKEEACTGRGCVAIGTGLICYTTGRVYQKLAVRYKERQ